MDNLLALERLRTPHSPCLCSASRPPFAPRNLRLLPPSKPASQRRCALGGCVWKPVMHMTAPPVW